MLAEESKYKWSAWLQPVLNTDTDWGVVSASSVHEDAGSDDFAAFRALMEPVIPNGRVRTM